MDTVRLSFYLAGVSLLHCLLWPVLMIFMTLKQRKLAETKCLIRILPITTRALAFYLIFHLVITLLFKTLNQVIGIKGELFSLLEEVVSHMMSELMVERSFDQDVFSEKLLILWLLLQLVVLYVILRLRLARLRHGRW